MPRMSDAKNRENEGSKQDEGDRVRRAYHYCRDVAQSGCVEEKKEWVAC